MFETPTLDIQELRSVLTDAGHTAVGFAALAAKRANDVRLDLNDRYDEQTKDLRSNIITVVEKFADARTRVEARLDPVIENLAERLPAPARKVVENLNDSVKGAQARAEKFVVDALSVETPKSAADHSVARSSVAKASTAAKAAKAPFARKTATRKNASATSDAVTTVAKSAKNTMRSAARTTDTVKTAARSTAKSAAKSADTVKIAAKNTARSAAKTTGTVKSAARNTVKSAAKTTGAVKSAAKKAPVARRTTARKTA